MIKSDKYWLVFRPGEHWTHHFLHKRFGHVFVLTKDNYNWYKIDPDIKRCRVDILSNRTSECVPKLFSNAGFRVIQIETVCIGQSFFGKIMILNCVMMVKYITGIRVFAFSPWGLYLRLLKMYKKQKYSGGILNIKYII